jgi:predicted DNA-binding transcriptional regulator AlpA
MPTFHLDKHAEDIVRAATGEAADDLLSETELARWLGVSNLWLQHKRRQGGGPAFIRIGPKRIKYRRSDVIAWLKGRTYQSVSDYKGEGR